MYLHSADAVKAERALTLVGEGGLVSVQVLNELAHVLRSKFLYSWAEINHVLDITERLLQVDCQVLYSEDMQHGLRPDVGLRVVNPFWGDGGDQRPHGPSKV